MVVSVACEHVRVSRIMLLGSFSRGTYVPDPDSLHITQVPTLEVTTNIEKKKLLLEFCFCAFYFVFFLPPCLPYHPPLPFIFLFLFPNTLLTFYTIQPRTYFYPCFVYMLLTPFFLLPATFVSLRHFIFLFSFP